MDAVLGTTLRIMRAIFTRKEIALAAACALAFGLLSESASGQVAQALPPYALTAAPL